MNIHELIIDIQKSCKEIRDTLDREVVSGDIEAVNQKLIDLTMLEGLSSEMVARAKKVLHFKELQVINSWKETKLTPSERSQILKAQCYEEIELVTYTDRLNAGLHHAEDGLRTVISLYKEEMRGSLRA